MGVLDEQSVLHYMYSSESWLNIEMRYTAETSTPIWNVGLEEEKMERTEMNVFNKDETVDHIYSEIRGKR